MRDNLPRKSEHDSGTLLPRQTNYAFGVNFPIPVCIFCFLLAFISPGLALVYKHDVSGRLTSITAADGQIYQYRYDRAGNLLEISTEVMAPPAIAEPREGGVARQVELDLSGGTPLGGHTYHARGLPAGLSIDPNTGVISGQIDSRPGEYAVTYWSQVGRKRSELQTFVFKVEGFPATMVGNFAALLREDGARHPAGRMDLKVSSRGAFTGVLLTADGQRARLRGRFSIPQGTDDADVFLRLRPGAEEVSRSLRIAVSTSGTATGLLSFGTTGTARGVSDGRLVLFRGKNQASWRGTYGLLLDQSEWTPNTPDGAGYAVARVVPRGVMRLAGKLADGTRLTASFAPGSTRRYDLFVQPYGRTAAYLGGLLQVEEAEGDYFVTQDEGNALFWLKAANARHRSYRDGFGPLAIVPLLRRWSPSQDLSEALALGPDAEFGAILWGGGIDSTGTAILPLGAAALPSDAFAAAPAIGAGGGVVVGSNRRATKEEGEPQHASNPGGASVWWRWTAPANGSVTIETTGSDFDTLLAIYTGEALASLQPVAANDNVSFSETTSAVTFTAARGRTYHIAVDGKQLFEEGVLKTSQGEIRLTLSPPPSPDRPNRYGVPAALRLVGNSAIETAENVPVLVRGSIARKTGVFRGSFLIKDVVTEKSRPREVTRRVRFEGLLLPGRDAEEDFGAGFLILPALSKGSEEVGGMVIFDRDLPREKIE